eukprot:4221566-Prymnesium_polylepis.1
MHTCARREARGCARDSHQHYYIGSPRRERGGGLRGGGLRVAAWHTFQSQSQGMATRRLSWYSAQYSQSAVRFPAGCTASVAGECNVPAGNHGTCRFNSKVDALM